MAATAPTRSRRGVVLWAALLSLLTAAPAAAQILPWEVNVAEIEAGRLRALAQRLSKQNVLYQYHLGGVRKEDLVETARDIDRILENLERGSPSQSIPTPWTEELRERLQIVDAAWGPLRRIAVASPYQFIRASQDFVPPESRRGDPLLVRYFDDLSLDFVAKTEQLIEAYHAECLKTGLEICETARSSGYAAMIIERAAKEAVYVVVDIDAADNRERLVATIAAYQQVRRANDESPFFAAALDPERGVSARAAGELLVSLREDWDAMEGEFTILAAGDEENFDVRRMLDTQERVVEKVERLTAALVRYASVTYGS